jgi:MAF protein
LTDHKPKTILLASGSPRRRELLSLAGLPFEVTQADIDETPHPGESPAAYTVRLSQEKARAVLTSAPGSALVLGADTTVADGEMILGKPADLDEARAMLQRLCGRVHQVYTALTLVDAASGRSVTEIAATDVPMRGYTDEEIEAYIASGDPFDKAGAYAIQHAGFHPVTALRGCYSNVMGLPLCHLVRALRTFRIEPGADVPLRCQQHQRYDCDVTDDILAGAV